MKYRGFNPFGLPTLISILILILVYSVVAVLLVDVRQSHQSILKSMTYVAETYTIEKDTDQIILELNETYQKEESFDAFLFEIDNLESVNYDKERNLIIIELINERLKITVLLSIDIENTQLMLVSKRLSIINNQDYTQNGDPVYGGQ